MVPCPRIRIHCTIRSQKSQPFWQILEIHVVELVGCHNIIKNRQRRIVGIIRTRFSQGIGETKIVSGIGLRSFAEIVNPSCEFLAMRKPNCGHHFLYRKPSGIENVDDLRKWHCGSRQVSFDI
ncbi:hypothetical protein RJ641_022763 [Dillenia turbinata]|uniref:Uncharacterized protein n=1 Tax=Dillenia turbinata TaxID=194707 RepID=A0AAN8UMN2_9MAGN